MNCEECEKAGARERRDGEQELGVTWKQHRGGREGRSRAEGKLVESIKGEEECECRLNSKNRLIF